MSNLIKTKTCKRTISIVITILWMSVLINTDSYYSNYLYIGLLCLTSLAFNVKRAFNKYEKIITLFFSTIFSILVTLANYSICLGHGRVNAILIPFLIFCSGMVVFYIVLKNSYIGINKLYVLLFKDKAKKIDNISDKTVFLLSFLGIVCIDLFVLFLSQYPGEISPDSLSQIRETLTGKYTNISPYWHTMIIKVFCGLGYSLFGNINAAVATYSIFQIVTLALIESYANMTLKQFGTNTLVNIIFCLFFMIVPYNYIYSMTMWKDVLFGGILLLFIVCFIRIVKNLGHKVLNYIVFFISCLGFGLLRSNGRYALILCTIFFIPFLIKNNKKLLLMMLVSLGCVYYLEYPYLEKRNIITPDLKLSISIPVQQVARVVIDDGLTNEEYELLSKIVDVERIKNTYSCFISDPMTDLLREKDDLEYISANIDDYKKLYFQLGLKHPMTYLFAFVDQTRGYFNSGYEYGICALDVHHNELGIERIDNFPFLTMLIRLQVKSHFYLPFLNPLVSIGVHVWLVIGCLYIGIMKKNKYLVMMTLPLLAIVASLLIATPVFSEFRYAYSMFTCAYFLVLVSIRFSNDYSDDN